MRLPVGLKLRKGVTKYILKKAVKGIIPNEIIYRRKQGFAAPINEWLRSTWHPFVSEMITTSWFVREGILDRTEVEKMLAVHASGRRNESMVLWTLLNLSLWHRRWFEGGW